MSVPMMRLSEAAAMLGVPSNGPDTEVLRVSTDSRSLQPGDLFIALRGEKYDGGAFAAQALRQGVGRLIRSETDRGVLVIGDRRLLTRSYGNALLAALPPMRRLEDEDELMRTLDGLALTRASTRVR